MPLPNELLMMIGDHMTLSTVTRSRQVSRNWRKLFNPLLAKRLSELPYRLAVVYSIERPIVTAYLTIGWCSKLVVAPPPNYVVVHIKDYLDETWFDRLSKGTIMISWTEISHPPYLTPSIDDSGTIGALLMSVNLEKSDNIEPEAELGKRSRDEYEYDGYPDDLSSDI